MSPLRSSMATRISERWPLCSRSARLALLSNGVPICRLVSIRVCMRVCKATASQEAHKERPWLRSAVDEINIAVNFGSRKEGANYLGEQKENNIAAARQDLFNDQASCRKRTTTERNAKLLHGVQPVFQGPLYLASSISFVLLRVEYDVRSGVDPTRIQCVSRDEMRDRGNASDRWDWRDLRMFDNPCPTRTNARSVPSS